MASFEQFFQANVEPLLGARKYERAISEIEDYYPQLANEFDRSEAFHWLASLHSVIGSQALANRDVSTARHHFGDVQEFALKALDQFADRPDTLVFLARFCLAPLGQPERAFPLLEPFAPGHRIQPEALLFYNHVRLVLRGVVLAIHGSIDEAFEDLHRAYSPEFMALAPDKLDTSTLFFLPASGITLPPERLSGLLACLGEMDVAQEKLDALRERLG